ncbi:MAG: DNA polymerase/3'-5' exonuclease PolX [Syntrophomonadaceae bacterium]|nr:DNA polymerase/3'-5' exonuclease PolX [Syntrophomonadaceae bacterium]MDD3024354.1 DNA polymerase/3'-5' exonuclease PolX [Syntrophomonadaceae bacterium]
MTNREVAIILDRIADILQIKNENPFKIQTYRKAANSIYHLDEDINTLKEANRIKEIPGVGKAVKAKIEEMIEKGRCEYYERLTDEVPAGVLEMLSLPGIGHKTVKTIYEQLGIDNLDDLLQAAEERKIRNLPGMGGKTEYNIKKGMELLRQNGGKVTLGLALPLAENFRDFLLESKAVEKASIVGSIRRGKSLVSDIDILVCSVSYLEVLQKVNSYKGLVKILENDPSCIKGLLTHHIEFEVIIVPPQDYFSSMVWTTGSKAHRQILFEDIRYSPLLEINNENDFYNHLGMDYIPPELRENCGEIELAAAHKLSPLLSIEDIKGDLHIHSNWSDGAHEIKEMAAAAKSLNYSYIAITDHSKSLAISGGLNEERIRTQQLVIDKLNEEEEDFQILRGSEVDILKDGSLDYDDELLKGLDVVIASVHSNFKLDKEKQSERIMQAAKNKHVDIIAHLTGRLLNRRSAYELDLDRILETAAKNNTILEINAHPDRLDIDENIARQAKEMGIKMAVNSDAHHKQDLGLMRYGVTSARRGWLAPEDVVNTWEKEALFNYLRE